MYIVGITPREPGAIAVLHEGKNHVFDIPSMPRGKKKGKNEIDCWSLYLKLEPLSLQHENVVVYLEQVSVVPGQDATSVFSMAYNFGVIRGVVASLGFELILVTAQKWKKYFNLTNDKELSRTTAIRMFPDMSENLQNKKDSDRAEALLIAHYGLIHYEG